MNNFFIKMSTEYNSDEIVKIMIGVEKGYSSDEIISKIKQILDNDSTFEVINFDSNVRFSSYIRYGDIQKIEEIEGISLIKIMGSNDLPITTNPSSEEETNENVTIQPNEAKEPDYLMTFTGGLLVIIGCTLIVKRMRKK